MWKKGSRCRDSKGREIKRKTFRKDRVRQRLEGEETEEWGGGGGGVGGEKGIYDRQVCVRAAAFWRVCGPGEGTLFVNVIRGSEARVRQGCFTPGRQGTHTATLIPVIERPESSRSDVSAPRPREEINLRHGQFRPGMQAFDWLPDAINSTWALCCTTRVCFF